MKYSECVYVVLVTQHAKRMRPIVLLSVACPGLTYIFFFTWSHKRHNFRKRVIEHKMCVNFLYNFRLKIFLILRRIQRGFVINVGGTR